jgi:hypothetical protein
MRNSARISAASGLMGPEIGEENWISSVGATLKPVPSRVKTTLFCVRTSSTAPFEVCTVVLLLLPVKTRSTISDPLISTVLAARIGGEVGCFVGGDVGRFVGGEVGGFVGGKVGDFVGGKVGDFVGGKVGDLVGGKVGDFVGGELGCFVGGGEGCSVVG